MTSRFTGIGSVASSIYWYVSWRYLDFKTHKPDLNASLPKRPRPCFHCSGLTAGLSMSSCYISVFAEDIESEKCPSAGITVVEPA